MKLDQFFDQLAQAGLTLNQQQQAAVAQLQGPLMVIAGPGSGKTRVITARTAALLYRGVSPQQILVLTFTRAAAKEMKKRLTQLPMLSQQQVKAVNMSTFHSLCYRILWAFQGQRPAVAKEKQRRHWVKEALLRQQEEIKDDLVDEMLHQISFHKNSNQDLEQLQDLNTLTSRVWADYEKAKNKAGLLDYDDLLLATLKLLQQYPELLQSLQRRWQFIMVDEFQDTNLVQYELLKLLAAPHNHICVVGDIDQAIYAWRAADPKLLLQFPQDFPGGRRVELIQNYRSLPPIVELANRLIAHNQLRHKITVQPIRQGGTPPRLMRPSDEWAEAKAVLTMLRQWQRGNTPLNELAVLYRVNTQARPLVSLLVESGFPFKLHDKGQAGLEHWVVQECHAFLRLLNEPNHMESFLRVGRRQLGLTVETNQFMERLVQQRGLTPFAAYRHLPIRFTDLSKLQRLEQHLAKARQHPPGEALKYYLHRMGFGSYLEWYAVQRGYPADEFLNIAEELVTDLRRFTNTEAYLTHLDDMLSALQNEQQEPGVNLMTMHSAKGLEFKAVWILGVIDGLLPHSLSTSATQREEERRLFYVGCTRAKDYLYLLAPKSYRGQATIDSPFLAEAGIKQEPATRTAGGRAITAAEAMPTLSTQPPPPVGQLIRHKDLGIGTITGCTQEKARGQTFHVLTINFPARSGFKLHWELSLQMGFIQLL
ncbi:MAG: ATP-dependent helicase [Firmicutes bacterium]|nr:ATP-dependent helicase [Bacillota bacterium]